jgi:hypothetical protein
MTRRSAPLLVIALLATVVGIMAADRRPHAAVPRSGAASGAVAPTLPRARTDRAPRTAAGGSRVRSSARPAARAPVADARAALPAGGVINAAALPDAAGTYLAEMVASGAAALSRWDDRRAAPVRVWLAAGDTVPGWGPAFDAVVRQAFASWELVGLPLRFAFVEGPDEADVRVAWTERLPERRAGVAHWTTGADGWLANGVITLATWVSDGTRADDASVYRMALHEIGHLLGLGHSADPDDVMAPWVRAGELTLRDRATARLLYTLTPAQVADAGRLAGPAGE